MCCIWSPGILHGLPPWTQPCVVSAELSVLRYCHQQSPDSQGWPWMWSLEFFISTTLTILLSRAGVISASDRVLWRLFSILCFFNTMFHCCFWKLKGFRYILQALSLSYEQPLIQRELNKPDAERCCSPYVDINKNPDLKKYGKLGWFEPSGLLGNCIWPAKFWKYFCH